ncbi:MAG: hypothetical protein PUC87_08225 [Galactobacillus timonensis]|jgi:hypothetical protein|uniref:hypothetical protein n=1 Tax=Galactobacillus timonensis TaxID=2041840 RepID=UPI0023F1330E|nr:hypothetical protein [Galactobacillus timonensis]MCI6753969.1 hypothetical protein [Galactobacillus timonensis]MDD5852121.1 hypothetical protein [Galactobacillus timonensis]
MARIKKTLEERRRYQNQYKIDHTVKFTIRFINDKDQDIIDKLQSQQNKTDYLRRLVREDIERGGK